MINDQRLMLSGHSFATLALNNPYHVAEGIDDINQCIQIILQTPKGSVPHRPWFGCDAWQHLDSPINVVRPKIVRDIYEALWYLEPRIDVMSVHCSDADDVNHVMITVIWTLKHDDDKHIVQLQFRNLT